MVNNILELIPQRPPMVMIDQLTFCEGPLARGTLMLHDDNVFLNEGVMTESGMIEALAQTAAARTGWRMREEERGRRGEDEIRQVPVGVIGSIKDFQHVFSPRAGEEMEMAIEVLHEFMNASVISGRVRSGGRLACSLEMKIFLVHEDIA